MCFNGIKSFIAHVMLNAASIIRGSFLINSQIDEQFCEHYVTLVDTPCLLLTGNEQCAAGTAPDIKYM